MYKYISDIPYSGKLSRDKMFAKFRGFGTIRESFLREFKVRKCTCEHASHPTVDPRSFLREIFYFHIFAKVLSLESFPLYGRSKNHSM